MTKYTACVSMRVFIDIPIEAATLENAVVKIKEIQDKMIGENILILGSDVKSIGGEILDFEMLHVEGISRNE